jgi:cysteinyl-tRNA synthetase
MHLRLHNTLTKQIEPFTPQSDNLVKLYTCGPTVYNHLHVGNWTAYIYWDTLVRTLTSSGYTVERVMNITDVGHLVSDEDTGEDKLEKGARREGTTAWEVAKMYSEDFLAGMKKLNLMAPQHITRATDYIPQQLELVRTLHDKGYTYQIDDGIYFDVSRFPSYADFAGLDLDAQKAGARVEHNNQKRNPSDFALWKFSPVGEKRDMEWATPADILDIPSSDTRMGFPGWHLECSAMAMDIFGPTLDIHTGGIDHIPVHHTNEIYTTIISR